MPGGPDEKYIQQNSQIIESFLARENDRGEKRKPPPAKPLLCFLPVPSSVQSLARLKEKIGGPTNGLTATKRSTGFLGTTFAHSQDVGRILQDAVTRDKHFRLMRGEVSR
jgi:hypothetical protein